MFLPIFLIYKQELKIIRSNFNVSYKLNYKVYNNYIIYKVKYINVNYKLKNIFNGQTSNVKYCSFYINLL